MCKALEAKVSCQKVTGRGVGGASWKWGWKQSLVLGHGWSPHPAVDLSYYPQGNGGNGRAFEHGEVGCVCILESSFRGRGGGCMEWRRASAK